MGTSSALEFNNTSFSLVSWFNSTSTAHSRFVSSATLQCRAWLRIWPQYHQHRRRWRESGRQRKTANDSAFGTTTTFNDGNSHQAVMVVDQTAKTVQIYVDGVAQPLTNANCGTVSGTTKNFSSCSLVNTYSTTEPFTVGAYKSATGGIVSPALHRESRRSPRLRWGPERSTGPEPVYQ